MKQYFFLLLLPLFLFAGDADTTYGRFHPTTKTNSSTTTSSYSSSEHQRSNNEEDDDFSLFGAILAALFSRDEKDDYYSSPYSKTNNLGRSDAKRSMGRSLYGSVGLGGYYHNYEDLGSGGLFSPTVALYWFSPVALKLRLRVSPAWGEYSIEVDFEQPRYINDTLNVSRTFFTDSATLFQLPICVDMLLAPGNQEFFNIVFGGGVSYSEEKMEGVWSDTKITDVLFDTSWDPKINVGFALMVPNSWGAFLLECSVSSIFHDNEGQVPTLSDNSSYSIHVGGTVSILF